MSGKHIGHEQCVHSLPLILFLGDQASLNIAVRNISNLNLPNCHANSLLAERSLMLLQIISKNYLLLEQITEQEPLATKVHIDMTSSSTLGD